MANQHYSDIEVVIGLQKRQRLIEEWFYRNAKQYFFLKFNEVFFDQDMKMTIFQESFIKLWTQIENGTICIIDEKLHRKQIGDCIQMMTCTLNTFLFAIAKNEYRELVRNNKELYVENYFENINNPNIISYDEAEDTKEEKIRIVDECMQEMSHRCLEILTLFYLKGKSLDEIMELRKDKHTSKVGLKTSKYKCINTLRKRITEIFNNLRYNI